MMISLWRCVASVLAVALFLSACVPGSDSEDMLKVVVTTTILGDVVRNVVGERAEVEVLMPVGVDPHEFQVSARQAQAIQTADLVVANGLGLEASLVQVLDSARSDGANVFEIGPLLQPVSMNRGECDPTSDDYSEESGCDPHIWFDPSRVARAAMLIAEQVDRIDASGDWGAAAAEYGEVLMGTDAEIAQILAAIPEANRVLVTNHDALGYFAERYGLIVIGTVVPGGSTLGEPSSAELAALVATIREYRVTAIFAESIQPAVLARAVADEVGSSVVVVELYTDSLGAEGTDADTLVGLLITNARLIAGALS